MDGPWVPTGRRVIESERFCERDLQGPLNLGRTFDLAICLETAEHLPPEAASDFVAELCRLAPVVVFSAAAPLQGGDDHVNEQWPSYWRNLFEAKGIAAAENIVAGKPDPVAPVVEILNFPLFHPSG